MVLLKLSIFIIFVNFIMITMVIINIYIVLSEFKLYENISIKDKKMYILFSIILSLLFFSKTYLENISIIGFLLIGNMLIDIKNKELSTKINSFIAIEGIIYILVSHNINHIITAFGLYFIYLLISIISKESLGRGDADLIFGLGLFIPQYNALKLLFYPFFLSFLYSIIMLFLKKNKKYEFPFTPFMIFTFYLIMIGIFNYL